MKRIIVILMMVAMVSSCAGIKDFLCKPTANQQTQAQIYLSKANSVLDVLTVLPQVPAVLAAETALRLAMSTFSSILDGLCVNYDVVKMAQNTVDQQEQVAMQLYLHAKRGTLK